MISRDHAMGLPVLRSLSLRTCCRHYPGAAAGRTSSLIHRARAWLTPTRPPAENTAEKQRLARRLNLSPELGSFCQKSYLIACLIDLSQRLHPVLLLKAW